MSTETPQVLLLLTVGCFALGWLIAKVGSYLGRRGGRKRDPRDDRIRSLEADLRVAQSSNDKGRGRIEALEKELAAVQRTIKSRDVRIRELEAAFAKVREDLKDSVKKTRELRTELTERAAERVRCEVKLREVETELSIVQASSSMIATGMLDYTTAADEDEESPAFKAGI